MKAGEGECLKMVSFLAFVTGDMNSPSSPALIHLKYYSKLSSLQPESGQPIYSE